MSAPLVLAVNGGVEATNTTTHTINLPNGSNVVGRRIVVATCWDNQQVPTFPAGWVELGQANGQAGNSRLYAHYHDVDGTEGYPGTGATISVTVGTTDESAHGSWLIAKDTFNPSVAPEITTADLPSTGSTVNPPAITPAGGTKDYLFIALAGVNGSTTVTVTGFPTGYSNTVNSNCGNANGVICAGAIKAGSAVSTEDPDSFTLSEAKQREAITLAIYPVEDVPGGTGPAWPVKTFVHTTAVHRASRW